MGPEVTSFLRLREIEINMRSAQFLAQGRQLINSSCYHLLFSVRAGGSRASRAGHGRFLGGGERGAGLGGGQDFLRALEAPALGQSLTPVPRSGCWPWQWVQEVRCEGLSPSALVGAWETGRPPVSD